MTDSEKYGLEEILRRLPDSVRRHTARPGMKAHFSNYPPTGTRLLHDVAFEIRYRERTIYLHRVTIAQTRPLVLKEASPRLWDDMVEVFLATAIHWGLSAMAEQSLTEHVETGEPIEDTYE